MDGLIGLILGSIGADLHDALRAAGHRAGDQGVKRLASVIERAPQHGHIHPGDDPDARAIGQALDDVARCGAEHVGQDQGLATRVGFLQTVQDDAALRLDLVGGQVGRHIQHLHGLRRIREAMLRRQLQGRSQRSVRDEEQAGHDNDYGPLTPKI